MPSVSVPNEPGFNDGCAETAHGDHEPHGESAALIDCEGFPRRLVPPTILLPVLTPFPFASTFQLHSRPSARHVIYLDFDGHTTAGTWWNKKYTADEPFTTPAYSIDESPSFTNQELSNIQNIWEMVAEDFAPFDVNVTTEQPPLERLRRSGEKDQQWGVRVVIGGTATQWHKPDVAGVAYRQSFTWDSDTPCYVFEEELANGDPFSTAVCASHEIGHTLGLQHDGRSMPAEEYYKGHISGDTNWAPIMGNGLDASLVQWSRGDYGSGSNPEDDLAVITSRNGFGYVPDEFGNTLATAPLLPTPGGSAVRRGIIATAADTDVFRFFTWDKVTVTIKPESLAPNLDVLAKLWNAAGKAIHVSNPADALDASFDLMLEPGFYALAIRGAGKGTAGDGYTTYGSIGPYTVSLQTNPQPPVVSIAAADAVHAEGDAGSKAFAFTVTRSGSTTGTTTAAWAVQPGGTATAADFAGKKLPKGKLTFVPGQTTAVVNVFVAGDYVLEPHETFVVKLTKVTSGSTGTATATGVIFNDDLYRTAITIAAGAARLAEGNAGSTTFTFTVTRSGTLSGKHSVKWAVATGGGTAADAGDFVGNAIPYGTITFAPGETVKKITVKVRADLAVESDEPFAVTVSDLVGDAAGIAVSVAGAVIANDDKPA
jgi:hypothetical protein